MKKYKFLNKVFSCFSLSALVFLVTINATAQEPATENQISPAKTGQADNRPSLLRQLDLTREQIQQLRRINQETRENLRTASQRQREARRALDAAIYADSPSEAEVERLLREFAEAQTEVTKLRAKTEFRIRQVLTPEQLVRFRELRGRAIQNKIQQRGNQQFPAIQPNQNRQKRRFPPRRPL